MSAAAGLGESQTFSFSGTLLDIIDHVEYRRVDLSDLADPVYRLRYEAYAREGYIPVNDEKVATDAMDRAPNVQGYGIFIDGQLVSSVRLHHLTAAQPFSPSMSIYSDILKPMLEAGASFIDPTRMTSDFEASLAYPALPFLSFRIAAMAAIYYGASHMMCSVRPQHVPFYRRVFLAEQWGGIRYYPGLSFPCMMMVTPSDVALPHLHRRYPMFASTAAEREALFAPARADDYGRRIAATARLARAPAVESPMLESA